MNYCPYCLNSFSSLNNTWTNKTTLHSSPWDPFKDAKDMKHVKENYYNSSYSDQENSWTIRGNITPDNSPIWTPSKSQLKPIKDGYMTIENTWTGAVGCKHI
jgi:hypothetical protein